MANLALGSIVSYKNDYWVALAYDGCYIKIIAPHLDDETFVVSKEACTLVDAKPMAHVSHNGTEYLVSAKGTIISAASGRLIDLNWRDGNLEPILAEARAQHYNGGAR